MALLIDSISLFVQIGLEVWVEEDVKQAQRAADEQRDSEESARLRARLRTCVTQLQRVHEIDAQRDLLRISPPFEGRERALERLESLRKQVLRAIKRNQAG